MNTSQLIREDHRKKSDQLRKLKKKCGERIPRSLLIEKLRKEKAYELDYQLYQGACGYDDAGYREDEIRRDARIELLEELLKN